MSILRFSLSLKSNKRPTTPIFAAPGIDGEWSGGIFNSGAGLLPNENRALGGQHGDRSLSVVPPEADTQNPSATRAGGGGFKSIFPATKPASAMRKRPRGVSIWGGPVYGREAERLQKSGGIVDHNAGADMNIAGGKGAASSLVRLSADRDSVKMKLPTLPPAVVRGDVSANPTGGQMPGFGPAAPLISKLNGYRSIFNIIASPSQVQVQK